MGPMGRPETSVRSYNYSLRNDPEERNSRLLPGGSLKLHLIFPSTFSFLWRCNPTRTMTSSFLRFLDHTRRRITVGRTHLDEWSARRRDLYLTTHNTHNRQTSMLPGGIRTHDLRRRAAADLRLRPRRHWEWHSLCMWGIFWWFTLVCV